MNRDIIYTNSSCEVKVYHYTNPNNFDVDTFIVDDVLQVMTEKTMNSPSGTFTFKTTSSKNWKKIIKPGDWVTISFSNGREKRIKMIGNIDRISRTKEIDEIGALVTRYMFYGRDFGKVFEKTNIYFNPYFSRQIYANNVVLKEGIFFIGSPTDIIKNLLQVFIGPGTAKIKELQQWYIPNELKQDVLQSQVNENAKSDGASFFDILDQSKIENTVGFKSYKNISNLQGFLWNILKQNSHESINELFLELQYNERNQISKPSIVLRPLPFTRDDFEIPDNIGDLTLFKDLPRVKVTDRELIFEDLGESDHVRFNFIFMTASNIDFSNINAFADWTSGSPRVPIIDEESIKKYGLLMRTDVSDFSNLARDINEKFDPKLLKNLNLLLNHWFENAHELESGTMKVVGNVDIELGKALEITYSNEEKYLYYIEGYANEWQYPNLWTTTAKLTRGYRINGSTLEIPEESNDEDKIYTGINKIDRRN